MSTVSRSNGSAPPTAATLRETIGRLAPGTALRDGLERILRGLAVCQKHESVAEHALRKLAVEPDDFPLDLLGAGACCFRQWRHLLH
ncbi:MAG TPA: hypothetical protein PLP04_13835 [Bryobacteraceae bacterium]|nr:hypothetical protein [Bryobacteraceae bacterium]